MAEQSHREEMSAAIRAQRERRAVPRSLAPPQEAPPPEAEHEPAPETKIVAEQAAPEPPPADESTHEAAAEKPRAGFIGRLLGR